MPNRTSLPRSLRNIASNNYGFTFVQIVPKEYGGRADDPDNYVSLPTGIATGMEKRSYEKHVEWVRPFVSDARWLKAWAVCDLFLLKDTLRKEIRCAMYNVLNPAEGVTAPSEELKYLRDVLLWNTFVCATKRFEELEERVQKHNSDLGLKELRALKTRYKSCFIPVACSKERAKITKHLAGLLQQPDEDLRREAIEWRLELEGICADVKALTKVEWRAQIEADLAVKRKKLEQLHKEREAKNAAEVKANEHAKRKIVEDSRAKRNEKVTPLTEPGPSHKEKEPNVSNPLTVVEDAKQKTAKEASVAVQKANEAAKREAKEKNEKEVREQLRNLELGYAINRD